MATQPNTNSAGPAMSALTPEQIRRGKQLLDEATASWNSGDSMQQWRLHQSRISVWLFENAPALLAAAESVGRIGVCSCGDEITDDGGKCVTCVDSLRAQLTARQKELDRQEELEAENCPEDQSWLQTLQAARRERDEALERLEIEQGEVSALNESRNRLEVQLTAREQENETLRKYFIDGIEGLLTKWKARATDKNWHGWEGPAATEKCAEDLAFLSVSSPSVPPHSTETRG